MKLKRMKKIFALSLLSSKMIMANVTGMDTQIFKPTSDGIDFVTVHSTQTMPKKHLNLGVYLNGAFHSFYATNTGGQTGGDSLLTGDFNANYGALDDLSFGFNAPAILASHKDPNVSGLYFQHNGFLEIALNAKYTVVKRTQEQDVGFALIPSINFPLVDDPYFLGANRNPIYNFEVALDKQLNKEFLLGFNLGYRLRNPKDNLGAARNFPLIKSQWIASAGLTYFQEDWRTAFTGEWYMATQANDMFKQKTTPMEVIVAAKHALKTNLTVLGGLGAGLERSVGNPDYRVFAGVNYYFGLGEEGNVDLKNVRNFKKGDVVKIIIPEGMVFFNFDRSELRAEGEKLLSEIVKEIKDNGNIKHIEVVGYTCSIGSDEYNQALSERRAATVFKYMIERKIDKLMMHMHGEGKKNPLASNSSFAGRSKNRRVELIIK